MHVFHDDIFNTRLCLLLLHNSRVLCLYDWLRDLIYVDDTARCFGLPVAWGLTRGFARINSDRGILTFLRAGLLWMCIYIVLVLACQFVSTQTIPFLLLLTNNSLCVFIEPFPYLLAKGISSRLPDRHFVVASPVVLMGVKCSLPRCGRHGLVLAGRIQFLLWTVFALPTETVVVASHIGQLDSIWLLLLCLVKRMNIEKPKNSLSFTSLTLATSRPYCVCTRLKSSLIAYVSLPKS